ncbi:MAG: MMPL family transporter, partial [Oscillospiraceae bacterium]|nr:MMPL family transporter [Oscillospiraceae bacterium]
MKKIADIIVEKRIVIFVIVMILTGVCAAMIPRVEINTDMTRYLPDKSSMKTGMDIMEAEFPDAAEDHTIRVMFNDLSEEQKAEIKERLSGIEYVSDVDFKADNEEYNRGTYTKYVLHTDYDYHSTEKASIEKTLESDFSENEMQYKDDSGDNPELPVWVVVTAVTLLTLILIIMSGSFVEPFLFLYTIGVAIAINLGTNVFLGSISKNTFSVAAILQLILSIDYSIILTTRYRQELKKTDDKKEAMKSVIIGAFSSISSSSITTVVGLLALVFMSFKIGLDMGVVLAKGVFLSVVCVFLILPGLILFCSGLIEKTAKPSPTIPTGGLAKFCNKLRIPVTICFVILFAGAYILQKQTMISYSLTSYDPIAEIFPTKSTVVLLYENKDDENVTSIAEELEQQDNVKSAANYTNTLNKQHTASDMVDAVNDLSENMGSGRTRDIEPDESMFNMLYYKYYGGKTGTMTAGEFMSFIAEDVLSNETFSSYIGDDMTENTELIRKLSDKKNLTSSLTAAEMSDLFGMEKTDCEQLYLYYFIKYDSAKADSITINEFTDFVLDDLADDENYSDMFDNDTLSQMEMLRSLTDTDEAEKEYTSDIIADKLGIDENAARLLFVYYFANSDYEPDKMTMAELTDFLVNDVAKADSFSSYFDADTLSQMSQLSAFADKEMITKQQSADGIASVLGMDSNSVRQMLKLDSCGLDRDGKTMTITEFTSFLGAMMNDPAYSSSFDKEMSAKIGNLKTITDTAASGKELSSAELARILQMDEQFADQIIQGYASHTGQKMTGMPLMDFIDLIVDNILSNPLYSKRFDDEQAAQLTMTQQLCKTAIAGTGLHINDFAQMFGMEEKQVKLFFTLYFGNDDKTMSLYDFADHLLSDIVTDPMFSSQIDKDSVQKIGLLKKIMELSVSEKPLGYSDSSELFGMDSGTMKMLYTLRESDSVEWKVSLYSLVDFLSTNKDNLSGMADEEMLSNIDMLKNIMDSAKRNEKLGKKRLAELTSTDESTAQQLLMLYTYKNGDTANWKLSAEKFLHFIESDILNDMNMQDKFSEDDKKKLTAFSDIITAIISEKEYTSEEMAQFFDGMTADMDRNSVSMLYLYHDSNESPDSTHTMSVEQL